MFEFTTALFPNNLLALPPAEAFERNAELLLQLQAQSPQEVLQGVVDSHDIKQQFFHQVHGIAGVPEGERLRDLSLQALAAGLLCGAVDGSLLYQLGVTPDAVALPEPFAATGEALQLYVQVAHQQWREMDADSLQLQAAYGKHINRATDQENIDFLAGPGSQVRDAQRAMAETLRTGYSLGLIDSAIVFVGKERPDPLQPA